MSQGLVIKDGNGNIKSLQVDSGSNGYISNHTVVSTATTASVNQFYYGSGWDWDAASGTFLAASLDLSRKGIIINNNSTELECYLLLNSQTDSSNNAGFGEIESVALPPSKYTFVLNAEGVYFGDNMTCTLGHSIFVPSSSLAGNKNNICITVTEIY